MKKILNLGFVKAFLVVLMISGCGHSVLQNNQPLVVPKDAFEKDVKIETIESSSDSPGNSSESNNSSIKPGDSTASGDKKSSPAKSSKKDKVVKDAVNGKAKLDKGKNAPSVKDSSSVKGQEKGAESSATEKLNDKSTGKQSEKSVDKIANSNPVQSEVVIREPSIEDATGFEGRRPLNDPYRVGEVVTHSVRYFKVAAGEIKFKVENFANVNGKKSYSFATELKTSPLFETFYTVDDRAVTQVGYDDLTPLSYQLHVKESGQLREARSFFDWSKNMAHFWEKKVTKKNGEELKIQDWEIFPYSQNVFSAIYYMRVFKWENGKEYSFRVAHDKENLVFKAKVIRRETIDTEAGVFKAVVVKPEFTVKGIFKPVGDIYIWLSDDDRKYVLKIESKIKIGTLISEVTSIQPGK